MSTIQLSIPKNKPLFFELVPIIPSYTDIRTIGAKVLSIQKEYQNEHYVIEGGDEKLHGSQQQSLEQHPQLQVGDILCKINDKQVKTLSFVNIVNYLQEVMQDNSSKEADMGGFITVQFYRAHTKASANHADSIISKTKVRIFCINYIDASTK